MAGQIQSPVRLEDNDGTSETLFNSSGNIAGKYRKAAMVPGGNISSMWFVYSADRWGHAGSGTGSSKEVGTSSGGVTVSYDIRSAQGFNMTNPGITLFEHSEFRGFGNLFQSSIPDITRSFPEGEVPGCSGAYISGGVWNLYKGFNYTGGLLSFNGQTNLGPGFYDFGGLPINDQAKSIRFVRPSTEDDIKK